MEYVKGFGCPRRKCEFHGIKDAGNLSVRTRYGPDAIRLLRCSACGTHFSERRGTPLFDLRIRKDALMSVVKHLAEGTGVRKTARLTGVSRDTVDRILKRVGKHAKVIHDQLVRGLEVPEVQMDEMWSFVKKKTRT